MSLAAASAIGANATALNQPLQVSASHTTVPKSIRGTWYCYDGKYKGKRHYSKYLFTKHYRYVNDFFQGKRSHYRERLDVYRDSHRGWYGINSTKKEVGMPALYRYSPLTIRGIKHRSLQVREGTTSFRMFRTMVLHNYQKFQISAWY